MSSIFPLRDTVTRDEPEEPRLVDLDEETADEVFEALAASTTRKIFLSLHEEPQTASDLAELTDTSVQNAQYHLQKLQDAGLISVVDTWYSERGSEMEVYAPDDESLVLYAGRDKQRSFRSLLNRVLGFGSVLIPSSIVAGWAASRSATEGAEPIGDVGDDLDAEEVYGDSPAEERSIAAEEEESDDDEADDDVDADDDAGDFPDGDDVSEYQVDTNETETFASLDADTAVWDVQDRTVLTVSEDGTVTALDDQQYLVDTADTESQVLITDSGNVTTLPADAMVTTTESTAALDPALAAGLAFFCGGLVVLTALWAWYGTPE